MVALVATVMVELAPDWTEDGLKLTLAPLGAPEAVRLTVWAPPWVTWVVTCVVAEEPAWTLPEPGLVPIEKSGPVGPEQVGSPLWAGTLTASQAALVRLNRLHEGSRVLAALRVVVRYFL